MSNLKQVKKATTQQLMIDASTLHYVLYERTSGFENINEDEMLTAIMAELEKRGHKIGWTGYTG